MRKCLKLVLSYLTITGLSVSIASEWLDEGENFNAHYSTHHLIPDVTSMKEWRGSENRRFVQDQKSGKFFPFKYYLYFENCYPGYYPPEFAEILLNPHLSTSLKNLILTR